MPRDMQTSLVRRQQRRRNGGRRRGGSGAARSIAIGLPLFLFASLAALALVGFLGVVGAYAYFSQGLADPHSLDNLVFNQISTIYDRTGTVQLATFGATRREVVTYAQLPAVVQDATTAVEDKNFWTNAGFDPLGIVSASLDTLTGDTRGASTITQQLVRQRLLDQSLVQDPNRKVERKIKEIIQSIRLTDAYPGVAGKQKILTAYLNQNFYGDNDYGILAAAEDYFGVQTLDQLTLAQAATLAGIPQSPTEYDLVKNAVAQPNGTLVVPATSAIAQRRDYILQLMEGGRTPISGSTYTAADFTAAMAAPIVIAPRSTPDWKAPQFVWQVRQELADELCGPGVDTCPALETGGLKVITTLDWRLQQSAEKWVKAAAVVPQAKNPKATAKALGLTYQPWMANLVDSELHNGALVAMDYQTGEVVAYVGSADYYAKDASKQFQPQFDVAGDGLRQPGSAFKPFNYVTGINDRTMTASTMFMDVVTNFGTSAKPYTPVDADHYERGPVTLANALRFSLNIPAVKALYFNGVDHVFDMARKMGLRFVGNTPTAGLSLTLGTEGVRPLDMVTAYSTLADSGGYVGNTMILSVTGPGGNNLITPYKPPASTPVVSPQAAFVVGNILQGNTDPSINPIWGRFEIKDKAGHRRPAALKTGTNDNTTDLSAYGFIAPPTKAQRAAGQYALAVGVWNGNSDDSPTSSASRAIFSFDAPTYVWQGFLEEATKAWAIDAFPVPDGVTQASVDAISGQKPGPFTTKTAKFWYLDGTQPSQTDETKVGVQVDSVTKLLWQDGCAGKPVTKGFLDLSRVEAAVPAWQAADQAWAARAARGVGVAGGPERTRTMTFYDPGFHPYGNGWGAPFPPTKTCPLTPSPTPSCDLTQQGPLGPPLPPLPPGQESPSPTPCPSNLPTPSPTPSGSGIGPTPTPKKSRGP
ncbi:MAG: transglycosylase domain-containing protein [Candidatus Limnocylindrales bacterium]